MTVRTMMVNPGAQAALCALSLVVFAALGAPAFSQDLGKPKVVTTTHDATSSKAEAQKNSNGFSAALDADIDDDGIIDAVETLVASKKIGETESQRSFDTVLRKDFSVPFHGPQRARSGPPRSACMDYLLLAPKDREKADLKIRSRTLGVFGTRPCDPFVSPMLERPFDTDYVEVPLLPKGSVILRE